jgi:hypothetical protein
MPDLPEGLSLFTVDEVAEAIDGVSHLPGLYAKLWSYVPPMAGADDAPRMDAVWADFSPAEQEHMRRCYLRWANREVPDVVDPRPNDEGGWVFYAEARRFLRAEVGDPDAAAIVLRTDGLYYVSLNPEV